MLTYVTGDRPPIPANIGDDAVRPIIEQLRAIGSCEQLDIFIYSRGGAIDVPWRLASNFRKIAEQWTAIIPFRANSAATLLSLGADSIIMGPQAELGPIDPILSVSDRSSPTGPIQQDVPVEDIMAFARFVTERFDLQDEGSRSAALGRLVDRIDAVTLGNAYRTHSHIRDLAKRMLTSTSEPLDEVKIDHIVSTLAEQVYAHGHAIGIDEAKQIGLPVIAPDADLEDDMWELLIEYESDLHLRSPMDPLEKVQFQDRYLEEVVLAAIDTASGSFEYRGRVEVQAQRQLPQNLQVNLNVPIQLPPGLDVNEIPAQIQQFLQDSQQILIQQGNMAVQQALQTQAPLIGCQVRALGASWQKVA